MVDRNRIKLLPPRCKPGVLSLSLTAHIVWCGRLESNQHCLPRGTGFTVRGCTRLSINYRINIEHTLSNVFSKTNQSQQRHGLLTLYGSQLVLLIWFLLPVLSPQAYHPQIRPHLQHVLSALPGSRSLYFTLLPSSISSDQFGLFAFCYHVCIVLSVYRCVNTFLKYFYTVYIMYNAQLYFTTFLLLCQHFYFFVLPILFYCYYKQKPRSLSIPGSLFWFIRLHVMRTRLLLGTPF